MRSILLSAGLALAIAGCEYHRDVYHFSGRLLRPDGAPFGNEPVVVGGPRKTSSFGPLAGDTGVCVTGSDGTLLGYFRVDVQKGLIYTAPPPERIREIYLYTYSCPGWRETRVVLDAAAQRNVAYGYAEN